MAKLGLAQQTNHIWTSRRSKHVISALPIWLVQHFLHLSHWKVGKDKSKGKDKTGERE